MNEPVEEDIPPAEEEEVGEEQIPEQNPEFPPEEGNMAANMARAMEAAFNRLARRTDEHPEDRSHKIQQRFQAMKPPVFTADGEPIQAAQWITSIERIFKSMRLHEDELRIENATLCLQGEAGEWWEGFESLNEVDELTWKEFRELFLDEFFPNTLREGKREEFVHLKQQDMTVEQYQRTFLSLARYAPELVSTEFRKIQKFEQGLRANIHIPVVAGLHKTYKDCVNSALRVEAGILQRQQADKERLQKRRPAIGPKRGSEAISQQKTEGPQNRIFKKPREFYAQPSQQRTV